MVSLWDGRAGNRDGKMKPLRRWIFQFIGHKIEGKKPSFFEDIQFLMIGPAWLLSFIYNRLGIRY